MKEIVHIDLFSGIGGFHQGLSDAGFKDNWTKFGMFPEIKMSQEKFNKLPNDKKIAYINSGSIKKEIPKSQRYKLCGNAVTRNIVELVGKKLLTHPQGNIL